MIRSRVAPLVPGSSRVSGAFLHKPRVPIHQPSSAKERNLDMNRVRNINRIPAALVFLLTLLILTACATSDDALDKMSAEELAFVDKIKMITPEMTESDVANLLGPVYRGSGTARPAWLGPTNDTGSQILVYFVDGRIYKVRWMKLGSFVWEYAP